MARQKFGLSNNQTGGVLRVDPGKVREKDGKARKPLKVEVSTGYLNSDYRLQLCSDHSIGNTGLLVIFRLTTKSSKPPEFIGRWDEKDNSLDVDILGVDKAEKSRFKRGEVGCSDHHPTMRITSNRAGRTFHVNIQYRCTLIFDGVVCFGLHRELELATKCTTVASVSAKLIKAKI